MRMPKAYPMYDADYKENVAMPRGSGSLRNTPNVYPGRSQRDAPLQQPGPLDVHRDALGREHLRRDHDVWDVNVEEEYHEEKAAAAPPHPNQ